MSVGFEREDDAFLRHKMGSGKMTKLFPIPREPSIGVHACGHRGAFDHTYGSQLRRQYEDSFQGSVVRVERFRA